MHLRLPAADHQLPSSSGIRMAALETDLSFRTSIESLIQLANIRLDPLLQSLLSSLDGLSRVSAIPAGTGPAMLTRIVHVGDLGL